MAIINEQVLSARLRAQGCALIDATWLASERARLAADEPPDVIPGWRWQVAARDVDAAPRSLIEAAEDAASHNRAGTRPEAR
jgi:hypothetical protein